MKTFVQEGNVLEFTAPAGGVTAGTAVKIGDILVVPTITAAEAAKFTGIVRGVVEHAKTSAEDWVEGENVHWDVSEGKFTTVTTGNYLAGAAAAAAANPSATGKVYLYGGNLGSALA